MLKIALQDTTHRAERKKNNNPDPLWVGCNHKENVYG